MNKIQITLLNMTCLCTLYYNDFRTYNMKLQQYLPFCQKGRMLITSISTYFAVQIVLIFYVSSLSLLFSQILLNLVNV